MRISRTIAVLATILATACGGGDDNGNPSGVLPPGATNGSFTATVNGAAWSASGTVNVSRSGTFIGLAGTGSAGNTVYAIVVGIGNATGPGTHSLTVVGGGDGSSVIVGGQTNGWGTAFAGGSGSVTITTLTANRVAGTFTATAVPTPGTSGAPANLVITNGQFDITF